MSFSLLSHDFLLLRDTPTVGAILLPLLDKIQISPNASYDLNKVYLRNKQTKTERDRESPHIFKTSVKTRDWVPDAQAARAAQQTPWALQMALAQDQAGNQAAQPRRPHSPHSFGRSSKSCIYAAMFLMPAGRLTWHTVLLENPQLHLKCRHPACLPALSKQGYHFHLLQGLPTHLSKTSWIH